MTHYATPVNYIDYDYNRFHPRWRDPVPVHVREDTRIWKGGTGIWSVVDLLGIIGVVWFFALSLFSPAMGLFMTVLFPLHGLLLMIVWLAVCWFLYAKFWTLARILGSFMAGCFIVMILAEILRADSRGRGRY